MTHWLALVVLVLLEMAAALLAATIFIAHDPLNRPQIIRESYYNTLPNDEPPNIPTPVAPIPEPIPTPIPETPEPVEANSPEVTPAPPASVIIPVESNPLLLPPPEAAPLPTAAVPCPVHGAEGNPGAHKGELKKC